MHCRRSDLNLTTNRFGVAPTYDTGPLLHPVDKEGINNDAMYTNCTVALSADTGELVWHYQHMANDQWDLDWVFERQIVNLPFNGVTRRVVMNVGKMAILDALDASTGEYLFFVDQNFSQNNNAQMPMITQGIIQNTPHLVTDFVSPLWDVSCLVTNWFNQPAPSAPRYMPSP